VGCGINGGWASIRPAVSMCGSGRLARGLRKEDSGDVGASICREAGYAIKLMVSSINPVFEDPSQLGERFKWMRDAISQQGLHSSAMP
jgi:hypothetical protein